MKSAGNQMKSRDRKGGSPSRIVSLRQHCSAANVYVPHPNMHTVVNVVIRFQVQADADLKESLTGSMELTRAVKWNLVVER